MSKNIKNFEIQIKYINKKIHGQNEKQEIFLIIIKHIMIFKKNKRRSRSPLKRLNNYYK